MPSFSAVLFVMTTKRAVRCTQDIQRTAGLSCARKTVKDTHDKRWDMFYDGRAHADVWDSALDSPITGHRDVNAMRFFGQRPLQTRSATLTALATAGSPRSVRTPAEESVNSGDHVVSHDNWECPSKSVQCTCWRSIGSIPLIGESTYLQILVLYAYSKCH